MDSQEFLDSSQIAIRSPDEVMRLDRMGAAFPTRISFMRRLIRRMQRECWKVELRVCNLDDQGFGDMLYVVTTPARCYSLICFSHAMNPEKRTDRVIAEEWDATFSLFDGIPNRDDIERLKNNTPKQEAGRFRKTELVMSRANKSVRLFERVVEVLSQGLQPEPGTINAVGYLMRTTAVYSNGKFGMCDRSCYVDRPELAPPFQAEMLTVYLIRRFTLDLVEHIAAARNPLEAVKLDRRLKRHLGIGNATGLGMAPFLISHPVLIHNWFHAREIVLLRIRSIKSVEEERLNHFRVLVNQAVQHVKEWHVSDQEQTGRIVVLQQELLQIIHWLSREDELLAEQNPWNKLYLLAAKNLSIEGQELLVSLLLEPYPEIVDSIGESLQVEHEESFNSSMTVKDLSEIIDQHYEWALSIDFSDPSETHHFWYYSQEKIEPRRGLRRVESGAEKEIQIAVAQDVQALRKVLSKAPEMENVATFMMRHDEHRHTAYRVQVGARYPYSEIRDNVISASCSPVDILRGKLAFFGALKFDPKSDLWTRITMYQGAPLDDELSNTGVDEWCFPVQPVVN